MSFHLHGKKEKVLFSPTPNVVEPKLFKDRITVNEKTAQYLKLEK